MVERVKGEINSCFMTNPTTPIYNIKSTLLILQNFLIFPIIFFLTGLHFLSRWFGGPLQQLCVNRGLSPFALESDLKAFKSSTTEGTDRRSVFQIKP